MNATQPEFSGFPVSLIETSAESVSARFLRISTEKGPLIPQVLVPEALGVSPQRAGQLLAQGRFEVIEIAGKIFVPLAQIEAHVPRSGGRPKKAA